MLLLITIFIFGWLHGGEQIWEIALVGCLAFGSLLLLSIDKSIFIILNKIKIQLTLIFIYFLYLSCYAVFDLGLSNDSANLYLFQIIIIFSIFILTVLTLKTIERVNVFLNVILLSALTICFYTLLNEITGYKYNFIQALPPWEFKSTLYTSGTFSYKNHFGIYISSMIILNTGLLFQLYQKSFQSSIKYYYWSCLLVLIVTFSCVDSRSSLILLTITFSVLLFSMFRNINKYRRSALTSFVVIIFIFSSVGITTGSFERLTKFGLADHGRVQSYEVAIDVFNKSPLFGTGPLRYDQFRHNFKSFEHNNTAMYKWVHNDYLEILVSQGIIGLVCFIAILASLVRLSLKRSNSKHWILQNTCNCISMLLLAHGLIDYSFSLPFILTMILTFLAINICLNFINEN